MTTETTAPPPAPDANDDVQGEIRPIDELEKEVAKWATENRNAFATRRDFNLALCDRLAARGLQPSYGVLRRLGARGTSSSQSEDVALWYRSLAARLGTLEANIPLGARRQANELIEQLWMRATHEVDERVAAPLRGELAIAQEQLAHAQASLHSQNEQLEQARQQIQALNGQLQEVQDALADLRRTSEALITRQREELQAEQQAHGRTREEARAQLASAHDQHALEVRTLHSAAEQAALSAADERSRLLRQVDEARQAGKEWQSRNDAVERRREQLQERVEQLLESEARAGAARDQAQASAAALQKRVEQLEAAERQSALEATQSREQASAAAARVHDLGEQLVAARARIQTLEAEKAQQLRGKRS